MTRKYKILTIVGTRPELIKMCRVIALMEKHTDHVLVHTGQNFDHQLNQVFFEELGIRAPDFYLGAAGGSPVAVIADILLKVEEALLKVRPDAVLIYGDTNSGLAVIAAKRLKIPVFHMEAGNRCFDQRVPEELNRKVIDHLSDVNMVLTEHARRYLIAEGLPQDRIFKVGSHMQEVLDHFRPAIARSDVLDRLQLDAGSYFLVSSHREENVDSPERLASLLDSLNGLVERYGHRVIVSTHPRTRKRMEEMDLHEPDPRITFLPPFGFFDYIKLQAEAACVISDSGTITEEGSLLGLRAVTIRQAHERPEGMDAGTLIMCDLDRQSLLNAVEVAIAADMPAAMPVADYEAGAVSRKVLNIVLSYMGFVNRVVWRKN
ncbi:MAG: UDP-N-acetylglucosamine 2-epimerase (non-hydrolyzing) [Rhizobiaceae bacterium]|nr:UDP-N-acetylglucosamine 2-epimerase (non-hydrolyzing) [Rhizobiaceae bacterium]